LIVGHSFDFLLLKTVREKVAIPHRLRNEGAEKCAENLDKALEGAIGYYQKYEGAESIAKLGSQELVSPIKARENLKAALMEFKPEEYVKFLYRNHPEELKDEHLQHLDQKQKDALDKKRRHDEKHKHHGHGHHNHGHGHRHGHHDENHEQETHHKHHHHNILDRYFGDDCSHHLKEEASEDEVTFQDLSRVDCSKESDGKKSSILPFPTHIHLPSLNIAPVNASMTFLERATGAVARIMGGRKYEKSAAAESALAENLDDSTAIADNVNGSDGRSLGSQGADSEAEFGFEEDAALPPNKSFTLTGRRPLRLSGPQQGVVAQSRT